MRDRLTAGIFSSTDPALPSGRLEQALTLAGPADAIRRIIAKARKLGRVQSRDPEESIREVLAAHVINIREAELLRKSERLRDAVIRVDSFADYGAKNVQPSNKPRAAADAA